MSLYEQVTPKCSLSELVLPGSIVKTIASLLEDFEFSEVLQKAGLPCRCRVLLHGPPGCGKTSIAHGLAVALKTKLYAASMAQAVESFLGGTEKKIEALFTFAAQNKCVLLLDEFDSIAASRIQVEQSADLSNNRGVNTLLTCLEGKRPLGLIVAATNFYDGIDAAVLRRFDLTIEVPSPSRDVLLTIAESVLKGRFGIRPQEILEEAATPSAVVRVAQGRLREKVIESEKQKRAETLPLFGPEEARKIRAKLESAGAAGVVEKC